MEARRYCWVMRRGRGHHQSLPLPTRQHRQRNSREAGPSNIRHTELQSRAPPRCPCQCLTPRSTEWDPAGGPLYVPDTLNSREGRQARGPSKCLNRRSWGERLVKEACWWPATRGWKKDSDRAMTPVVRQSTSLHPWHHLGPRRPSSCTTLTLNSHGGRAATGKKVLCPCAQGRFGSVRLCDSVDCGLPGFSVREGGSSPGRNTGAHWPMLVAVPF